MTEKVEPDGSVSEDILEGADEIAKFLGKRWNASRVRTAKHRGWLPIHKRRGIGLYAFKSELSSFLRATESLGHPMVSGDMEN